MWYGQSAPVLIFVTFGALFLIAAAVRVGSWVTIRLHDEGIAVREWYVFGVRARRIVADIKSMGITLSDVQFSRPRVSRTRGCYLYGLGSEILIAAGPREETAKYVLSLPDYLRDRTLESRVVRYGTAMPLF